MLVRVQSGMAGVSYCIGGGYISCARACCVFFCAGFSAFSLPDCNRHFVSGCSQGGVGHMWCGSMLPVCCLYVFRIESYPQLITWAQSDA